MKKKKKKIKDCEDKMTQGELMIWTTAYMKRYFEIEIGECRSCVDSGVRECIDFAHRIVKLLRSCEYVRNRMVELRHGQWVLSDFYISSYNQYKQIVNGDDLKRDDDGFLEFDDGY